MTLRKKADLEAVILKLLEERTEISLADVAQIGASRNFSTATTEPSEVSKTKSSISVKALR